MDLEALFNIIYKHLPIINQITDKGFKIPAISHHIWLTNYQNPKEIRDSDLVNLKRSLSIIDTNSSSTWQHILWTNCKSCIPKTIQQLKLMDIKVRDFVSIKDQLISYDAVSMHIS